MKKMRVLSLVLALLMCLGTVTLFASCSKKDGDVRLSKKKIDVDLTEYSLVYADTGTSSTYKVEMANFAAALNAATGLRMTARPQKNATDTATGYEILVGLTDRAESVEAHDKIKGYGFTIEVTDKKIVIVGTNKLLTLQAVHYFIKTFLSGERTPNAVLSINKTAKAKKLDMLTIGTNDSLNYKVIHNADADTNPKAEYGATTGDMFDFSYVEAEKIRQKLLKVTGASGVDHLLGTDAQDQDGAEIMIGRVDRDSCKTVLSNMGGNQYGVCTQDGDIVVTGWSDAGLMLAVSMFNDLLNDAKVVDPADETKFSYLFPTNMSLISNADLSWKTDFPKPEGLDLYNTMDCSDGALQYLYRGEGVDEDAFDAYTKALEDAGYELYADVAVNKVEGSCFATYINKQADTVLYVAYNAFAHRDELESSSYATKADSSHYFIAFDDSDDTYALPSIRIVSYSIENAHLGEESLYKKQTGVKIGQTNAALASVPLPGGSVGTGYVMMLEDGTFIVFDGGAAESGNEGTMIYNIISSMHMDVFGEISKNYPIHIRAWVNSHAHGDHTAAFSDFSGKYGKASGSRPAVQLDYIIGSYASASMTYNTAEGGPCSYESIMSSFASKYAVPPKYVEVHTGQKLYFNNVELEVLFTHEDLNPHNIVTGNDTSTLIRVSLQPTTNGRIPAGDKVSFMWTGDMYRYGGQWACATFGSDYLKSDMVAVTHHGGPGADEQFFDFVAAEAVWWPSRANNIMGSTGTAKNPTGGYLKLGSWHCKADQTAVYSDYAKYLFTATDYSIVLSIDGNGPKYDEIKKIENFKLGLLDIDLDTDHDGRNFWYKHLEIVS